MKLYEITQELEVLLERTDEYGELTEEIVTEINSLEISAEQKMIAVASYIKNLGAEACCVEEAIEAMKERVTRATKKIESLKYYLKSNMESLGITEISSSPYFKINIRNNPAKVVVWKEVPKEYLRVKTETFADKTKIREALLAGIDVQGAVLEYNTRVEIK